MQQDSTQRSVKSARRVLEILELYERLRRPAGVNEIADLLHYPQSSASVLLNSLKNLGYLSYSTADRTFAPSVRVALIGEWIRAGAIGRSELLDMMNRLKQETGGTIILSTRHSMHVQYIHIVAAPEGNAASTARKRNIVCAGTLRPICRVAPGFALLSDCSDAEIGKIVRGWNASTTRETVNPADLMNEIAKVRRKGYAVKTGNVLPHTGALAVKLPFEDNLGKPLVLSINGPADWIKENEGRFARLLRRTIAKTSGSSVPQRDLGTSKLKPRDGLERAKLRAGGRPMRASRLADHDSGPLSSGQTKRRRI